MPAIPVGGMLLSSFGGALGFAPFQGILPIPGIEPPTFQQTKLDVKRWELRRRYNTDDTTHTGTWATEGNAVVCTGFTLAAELLWDLYAPPNFIAVNGGVLPGQQAPDIGFRFWAYVGSAPNYGSLSPLTPWYYFAPSAKGQEVATVIDVDGKKMVRALIQVIGNGPIFAFGGNVNEQDQYDAYVAHCLSRNWTW